MSLRKKLSATIDLLDRHPDIATIKIGATVEKALAKFEEKFNQEVEKKSAQKPWEDLTSSLIRANAESAAQQVAALSERDFSELSAYLKLKPAKATKKLSARQASEAKVLKKIATIRKQTL